VLLAPVASTVSRSWVRRSVVRGMRCSVGRENCLALCLVRVLEIVRKSLVLSGG
jgi:hypothetical protein